MKQQVMKLSSTAGRLLPGLLLFARDDLVLLSVEAAQGVLCVQKPVLSSGLLESRSTQTAS